MPTLRRVQRKHGAVWRLYWIDPSARNKSRGQRSRTLGPVTDISEAQAKIALAQLELELGSPVQRNRTPTFKVIADQYCAWHAAEFPRSHWRSKVALDKYLVPLFGDSSDLKRHDLEEYKQARKAKPATVAKEISIAKAVLNWAVEMELIPRNPWAAVKRPQDLDDSPPRWFTRGELERLYESAGEPRRYWYQLAVNTGLRRGELLAARWDWVDGAMLRVTSTHERATKSGKTRSVPLNDRAREALAALKNDTPYVLPQYRPMSLTNAFRRDAARAGVTGSLHGLRHTFCSELVRQGVHLRIVQQLAGHSSIEVTERYARLVGADMVEDMRRVSL